MRSLAELTPHLSARLALQAAIGTCPRRHRVTARATPLQTTADILGDPLAPAAIGSISKATDRAPAMLPTSIKASRPCRLKSCLRQVAADLCILSCALSGFCHITRVSGVAYRNSNNAAQHYRRNKGLLSSRDPTHRQRILSTKNQSHAFQQPLPYILRTSLFSLLRQTEKPKSKQPSFRNHSARSWRLISATPLRRTRFVSRSAARHG